MGPPMTREQGHDSPLPEGELRIEILSWDWNLAVAISSELTPLEQRFQGGLNYVRGFELWSRVSTPETHRGKTVRIWISPFGPEIRFGPDEMDEVGRLYLRPSPESKADWTMSLMLPEDAIASLATSLGTVSKYLFVRLFDARGGEVSIDFYSFSSALPGGAPRSPND
jgi:hypothetical protein